MSRKREIDILNALITHGDSTAKQLAAITGISRTNAQSNLAKMNRKGVVRSPRKTQEQGDIRKVNVKIWAITKQGRAWVANPPPVGKPIRKDYPKVLSKGELRELHAAFRAFNCRAALT